MGSHYWKKMEHRGKARRLVAVLTDRPALAIETIEAPWADGSPRRASQEACAMTTTRPTITHRSHVHARKPPSMRQGRQIATLARKEKGWNSRWSVLTSKSNDQLSPHFRSSFDRHIEWGDGAPRCPSFTLSNGGCAHRHLASGDLKSRGRTNQSAYYNGGSTPSSLWRWQHNLHEWDPSNTGKTLTSFDGSATVRW